MILSNVLHLSCSFMCGEKYHAPTDCYTIKKWLTKCEDDSETANYITANTKDVSPGHRFNCLLIISKFYYKESPLPAVYSSRGEHLKSRIREKEIKLSLQSCILQSKKCKCKKASVRKISLLSPVNQYNHSHLKVFGVKCRGY